MNDELVRKYRTEIERLDGEIAHYDRLWGQVPQFAWAALFAPIAGYLWGWPLAFVELFVTAALVGVRAYLVAMRKSEIVWNRARLLEEMGAPPELREPAPHGALREQAA